MTVTTLNKIIEDLGYILEEFAQGNYAVRSNCKESYVGEFENVMTHLISMVTDVSGTFKQIRESSDQVAAGAEQLAISSQDLAKEQRSRQVRLTILWRVSQPYLSR